MKWAIMFPFNMEIEKRVLRSFANDLLKANQNLTLYNSNANQNY